MFQKQSNENNINLTPIAVKQMIFFLAQDIISTQKMELLLAKFGEVSGEGVEHDDLNIEVLVEKLDT